MHPAAEAYVGRALDKARFNPIGKTICEFGSMDVNGSVRPLFTGCEHYIGVDVRMGRGVDVVADAAEWGQPHCCDVVICCETLEHDSDPEAIIINAARILKPGGLFIMTAAGAGRGPHSVDGQALPEGEHYANIAYADLDAWLAASFDTYSIEVNTRDADIYALAHKAAK